MTIKDWQKSTILKLSKSICAGATPSTTKPHYWENGTIKWMKSGDVNLKRIYEVEGRITEEGYKNSSTKLLPKDAILIALAGQGKTRGTVAISKIELCTNQSIAGIVTNDKIIPDYLYYNLDARYEELRKESSGEGGRGGLNLEIIKNIKVKYPTNIAEQKKIAEILSCWDRAIESLKNLINAKQRSKLHYVDKLTCLKLFPVAEITSICDVRDGTHASPKYQNCGIPLVTQKNIVNGKIFLSNTSLISSDDAAEINKRSKVDIGDVLVSMIGTIGNAVYINTSPEFCIKNVALFKSKKDLLMGEYLYFYFLSSYFKRLVKKIQDGGIQQFLSLGTLRNLQIPLPHLNKQNHILRLLRAVEIEIELLERLLELHICQKKSLMQKLLTGKIRVKV